MHAEGSPTPLPLASPSPTPQVHAEGSPASPRAKDGHDIEHGVGGKGDDGAMKDDASNMGDNTDEAAMVAEGGDDKAKRTAPKIILDNG